MLGPIPNIATGKNDFAGSYPNFIIAGFITKLAEANNNVLPSGSELATYSAPNDPPAPGLFSTITGRFNFIDNC